MKTFLLVCLSSGLGSAVIFAAKLYEKLYEKDYQKAWAAKHGGKCEVRMSDGTRCDVVTDTHAIEFDWANNWAEAVGQSLWYSLQTDKKPGIVLILRSEKDRKHLIRLRSLIAGKKLQIDVFVIEPK